MAAISIALMAYLSNGEHVIVTKNVYGGTHKFLSTIATRLGIEFDYIEGPLSRVEVSSTI